MSRFFSISKAEKAGLVARVVPTGSEVEEAIKVAEKIASFSSPVVQLAKESQLFSRKNWVKCWRSQNFEVTRQNARRWTDLTPSLS